MNMHCTFKMDVRCRAGKMRVGEAFLKSTKLHEILLLAIKNPLLFNLRNFDDGQMIARLNALRALTKLDVFHAHHCLNTANARPQQALEFGLAINEAKLQISLRWPEGIKDNQFLPEMPALAKILLRADV